MSKPFEEKENSTNLKVDDLMITEKEIDGKCMRIANFLQVHQEQAVWWSQSYVAWLDNNQLLSPVRPQLPEADKTTSRRVIKMEQTAITGWN